MKRKTIDSAKRSKLPKKQKDDAKHERKFLLFVI